MKKEKVAAPFSFADAEFKSLELSQDGDLIIYLTSWDEKTLKIIFLNAIHFSFKSTEMLCQGYMKY